jgi:hypothetical protein
MLMRNTAPTAVPTEPVAFDTVIIVRIFSANPLHADLGSGERQSKSITLTFPTNEEPHCVLSVPLDGDVETISGRCRCPLNHGHPQRLLLLPPRRRH